MTDPRGLYGGAEYAPLWEALWRRFSSGQAVSRVRLAGLDDGQRAALADLLGMDRLPSSETTVSVGALDSVLRVSVGSDARTVTEAIAGPLDNHAERRAADRQARDELWSWAAGHEVVRAQPALGEWVTAVRRAGLVDRSVPATRELLARALAVLAELPTDGPPLSVFAGDVCGDTHALDDGTRLSAVVLRALAVLHDQPAPRDAEERRALWEGVGIACDALSTSVLVAGFRPVGDDPLAVTLRRWAESGPAAVVTLAQLSQFGPVRIAVPVVRVVENPAVVAMAVGRFGPRCPPLVTTSGWPNSASMLLLRQLGEGGVRLDYHGDFDGEGLRIAAYVMARTGARPWRMSAADYVAAVRGGRPDPGNVSEAPWDDGLGSALREYRSTVSEEHVAEYLLNDLAERVVA